MKKIINYIGVGLSIILMVMSFYYIDEVEKLRVETPFEVIYSHAESITKQVGVYSLFIFIFFLLLFIINYTNQKKMSMIGIGLTILIIIWDLIMLSSPSHISFNEVGYAWMIYGLMAGILFYIFTIHHSIKKEIDDVIDDFII